MGATRKQWLLGVPGSQCQGAGRAADEQQILLCRDSAQCFLQELASHDWKEQHRITSRNARLHSKENDQTARMLLLVFVLK